jgi:hypothetical protein
VAETARVILTAFYSNHLLDETGHVLVHGAAPGVDTFIASEAKGWGWDVRPYPADWQTFGKKAGPLRNQQMLDSEHNIFDGEVIELVLAFPAPDSRGTWDMVERAVEARIPVRVYPL